MAIENLTGFDVISDVGATANSYASIAFTKTLWSIDPYKDVGTFTDEDIGRALIAATKQINAEFGSMFAGSFYDDTYALFFPRESISDSRGVDITDMTVFPDEIIEATAVQAWYVNESNRLAEPTVTGVKKQEMDGLGSQEFFSPGIQSSAKSPVISEETRKIVAPYTIGGLSSRYTMLMGRG